MKKLVFLILLLFVLLFQSAVASDIPQKNSIVSEKESIEILKKEKLRSEIDRNHAEKKKILIEATEVKRKQNLPWYYQQRWVEALIAGVVAAGLLSVWFIGYLEPFLNSKNRLMKLENERLAAENELEKIKNEKERLIIEGKRRIAEERAAELVSELEDMSKVYKVLSNNPALSSQQKSEFKNLAIEAEQKGIRWQDDDSVYQDARIMEDNYSRKTPDENLFRETEEALKLHTFFNDDLSRQISRIKYAYEVMSILAKEGVSYVSVRAINLAGINQHNRSLKFKNLSCPNKHIEEIEILHKYLEKRAMEFPIDEKRHQLLKWLDIARHNMEVMISSEG